MSRRLVRKAPEAWVGIVVAIGLMLTACGGDDAVPVDDTSARTA